MVSVMQPARSARRRGNYFSAFALLLHASPFQIAILSALPQLVGVVAQLASVKLLQHLRLPSRLSLREAGPRPLLAPDSVAAADRPGTWLMAVDRVRDAVFRLRPCDRPGLNSLLVDVAEADRRGALLCPAGTDDSAHQFPFAPGDWREQSRHLGNDGT